MSKLDIYPYPRFLKTSEQYKVTVGNQNVRVFATPTGQFVTFGFEGTIELVINTRQPVISAMLRPRSKGVIAQTDGNRITIQLNEPGDYCLEVGGLPNLYLFLNSLEKPSIPSGKSNLHLFKAGQIYEVGKLELNDNDVVYIEAGAWVRGSLTANGKSKIAICGQGVLDTTYHSEVTYENTKAIRLDHCRDTSIQGITMIQNCGFTIYLFDCENVEIKNVRQITLGEGTDGIDICASRDILVDGCFLVNGDDNIAIKAHNFTPGHREDHVPNAERIRVQNCSLLNVLMGRPLEIGHEFLCDEVKNIVFEDIDILGSHGGPTFSINNSSYAVVRDVLYQNIRVEHYYSRLIDFRVIASRFAHTDKRGWIRDITLKDIVVTQSIYNPGYSTSLIGGYDNKHTVDNILFKNFRLGDTALSHPDQLDLFTRNCSQIKFDPQP